MRCYEILGIEGNATKEEILEAYNEKKSFFWKSPKGLSPLQHTNGNLPNWNLRRLIA